MIEREDVEIVSEDIPGWTVINDGLLTVALDLEITEELRCEGLAREIVKRIQTYRKESGFDITDRIEIVMERQRAVEEAVSRHHDYICGQVLADSFEFSDDISGAEVFDFDGFSLQVNIKKANR